MFSHHVWRTCAMGFLVMAAACGKQPSSALAQVSTPPASSMSRSASAANSVPAYRIYVTNELSGDLSIVDPLLGTEQRIALGKRPRGLSAAADGAHLFVALSGSPIGGPNVDERSLPPADKQADGIGVVNLSSGTLDRVLRGVSDPEQVAWSGDRVYVASEDTGKAIVLDAASGEILASIDVGGEPEGVAVSPDGRVLLVTSEATNHIAVVSTYSNEVIATIAVGARPRNAAFSPDGAVAYVPSENDARVSIIDLHAMKKIGEIAIAGDTVRPMGIVVSLDGSRLFVTTGRGGALVAIDPVSRIVVKSVMVGGRPWGIAQSPDGKLLFTANGPSNDIAVIDAGTLEVIRKIQVGDRPWGVAVVPTK